MKIGSDNHIHAISDNLLERINNAHQEALQEIEDTPLLERSASQAFSLKSAQHKDVTIEQSKLESRLLWIAEGVIEQRYLTPQEVRCEVIDAIVDEKYGDTLSSAQRDEITKTLQDVLVDDPGFTKDVDNMLIQAARHLGRGADPTAK